MGLFPLSKCSYFSIIFSPSLIFLDCSCWFNTLLNSTEKNYWEFSLISDRLPEITLFQQRLVALSVSLFPLCWIKNSYQLSEVFYFAHSFSCASRWITLGNSSPVMKAIPMRLFLHLWAPLPLPLNTDRVVLGILRYKGKWWSPLGCTLGQARSGI